MNQELFGSRLAIARSSQRLTQKELAGKAGLHQSMISEIEQGKRLPTLPQLLQLARGLKVPIQLFLTGLVSVGDELAENSIQLHDLGIVDLHVEGEKVPGAFRPTEDVVALVVSGNAPSARLLEAIPAVLAWNPWRPRLLQAFARERDERCCFRLGWLADIALTIHGNHGFPGGCKSVRALEDFVRLIGTDSPATPDTLGYAGVAEGLPPVSRRWRMHYPAPLATFQARAEHLLSLRDEALDSAGRTT